LGLRADRGRKQTDQDETRHKETNDFHFFVYLPNFWKTKNWMEHDRLDVELSTDASCESPGLLRNEMRKEKTCRDKVSFWSAPAEHGGDGALQLSSTKFF
jgi:hypothetical protein